MLLFEPGGGAPASAAAEELETHLAGGKNVWLDITDPQEEDYRYLADRFGVHPQTIEEMQTGRSLPRLQILEESSFISWYDFDISGEREPARFFCLVGERYLVTVHPAEAGVIEEVWAGAARDAAVLTGRPGMILYAVLDATIDRYFEAIDLFNDEVDDLEDVMLEKPSPGDVRRLFGIKRRMLDLRRAAAPEREVVNTILRHKTPYIVGDGERYYEDLYDHLVRIIDLIDTLRDMAGGAMQIYQATISNNLNAIMKTLTIIATIMMPLTLISGIWGMNLELISPSRWTPGFYWVMASMAIIGGGMLYWFRRRGWL